MNQYDVTDTIVAIATPPAGAGRGVVRLSGPNALEIAGRIFHCSADGTELTALTVPTALSGIVTLADPLGEVNVDALVWPTARSYTRQPTVELHTFGSPPILDAIVAAVVATGARVAQPGEFTLRAFLAGRLDLTQAEAVLGIIDAGDRSSLDTALAQLAGGLAGPLNDIRSNLLDLLAHLEAGLDFVDEDIEFISAAQLQADVAHAEALVASLIEQMQFRSTSDDIPKVVIMGWPNVGKSSLLNALTSTDSALVSPTAGATRDYVSRRLTWNGTSIELIDTAGVSEGFEADAIDRSAQQVSVDQSSEANLRLLCLDMTRPLNAWETQQLAVEDDARIVVLNKSDIGSEALNVDVPFTVSATTGESIPRLLAEIVRRVSDDNTDASVVSGTAARCQESLANAASALAMARAASVNVLGEELVAAELRIALEEIGKVAGTVYTDDVLDRIFSRFCIGK